MVSLFPFLSERARLEAALLGAELPPEPPGPAPRGSGLTFLVVDDDAAMRDYVRECLALGGAGTVLTAGDGHAALALLARHRVDLVVSDAVMPGLDGPGLRAAMAADPALEAVPVLLITGAPGELEGAVLRKPFNARTLWARVAALLEGGGLP